MNESDIDFIKKELNLLDATLQSSLRMIGQLRALVEMNVGSQAEKTDNEPSVDQPLRGQSSPILHIDELGLKPTDPNLASSTVDIAEWSEKAGIALAAGNTHDDASQAGKDPSVISSEIVPKKEDVDTLLAIAKERAKRTIIQKSNELLSQIDHKQQATVNVTVDSDQDVDAVTKFVYPLRIVNELINGYFHNSIIATGVGKIKVSPQLVRYDQNLRSVTPSQIVNYPTGFYTNTVYGTTQFLIKPDGSKFYIIFDNLETEPKIILLQYDKVEEGGLTKPAFNWIDLYEVKDNVMYNMTPVRIRYIKDALDRVTTTYF